MRLIALLCSLILPNLVWAQTLEYEVIRTEEAPGFFAVRLFPGQDLQPEYLEDVFVKNFSSKAEANQYEDLTKELDGLGAKVVSPEEARPFLFDSKYRVIVLGGEKIENYNQFNLKGDAPIMDQFQSFAENHLGPIYLRNISAEFGGNISEVHPDYVPYLNQKASYFIGKFEKPMKTRMALNATSIDENFQAEFPIDLATYKEHEISPMLPTLWEQIQKDPVKKVKAIGHNWALNAFPLLLAMIGILLILIAGRRPRQKSMEDLIDDEFWNTPIEETPLYKKWEENLPFETNQLNK